MRPASLVSLIFVTLLGVGAAFWIDAGEKPRRHWPRPTPPPPPSPIYTPSRERAWSEQEIEQQAREHNARLEAELESALLSKNAQRREAAFVFILPELVQVDSSRVVGLCERLPKGEPRDTLQAELTRAWVARDTASAIRWMKTLPDHERRASTAVAVEMLFAQNPSGAADLADQMGLPNLVRERPKPARN